MFWRVAVSLTVALAIIHQVRIVRVAGDSMLPAFNDGALLITVRVKQRMVRDGTVVTCADPRAPTRTVVKRVQQRLDDLLDLRGDNPAHSTDSRSFGLVRMDALTGVVVAVLYNPRRTL